MSDDLLENSETTVLRCVARAREEYMKGTDTSALIQAGKMRRSSTFARP